MVVSLETSRGIIFFIISLFPYIIFITVYPPPLNLSIKRRVDSLYILKSAKQKIFPFSYFPLNINLY